MEASMSNTAPAVEPIGNEDLGELQSRLDSADISGSSSLSCSVSSIGALIVRLLQAEAERDAALARAPKLAGALRRARVVLANMAAENEGAIFNRWPIHHEPLRADARGLLPVIDDALLAGETAGAEARPGGDDDLLTIAYLDGFHKGRTKGRREGIEEAAVVSQGHGNYRAAKAIRALLPKHEEATHDPR
jgi:hypothetical protein